MPYRLCPKTVGTANVHVTGRNRVSSLASLVLSFGILTSIAQGVVAANPSRESDAAETPSIAVPANPDEVLGNDSCVKCHAKEMETWKRTLHARTFDELHRRPEAKQIAEKLGLRSIKHERRCAACHYTEQVDPQGLHHAIAGISCESCHGAAKRWLQVHHDYGAEGITRLTETPAHRQQRLTESMAAGMRNPVNVFLVAQSCLRCHTTADEELVNVGGHSAGSLDFEFVSWSQGTVRHNFVRGDGESNVANDSERIRIMFVSGIIAELEFSLRAVAAATQKDTYGLTVAKRAARAGARIKSVSDKVESSHLKEVVSVFDGVTLKLNNADQLLAAADQIAKWGIQFAADPSTDLSSLDPFIPSSDRYK